MSSSPHSLIPLGSSNLSTHYTQVYLYPSSTSSMQPHLLTKGNRTTGSLLFVQTSKILSPHREHNPHTTCINKCVQTSKHERRTRVRPTYYSSGTNHGLLSSRTTRHTQTIGQHNGYNHNYLTKHSKQFVEGQTPPDPNHIACR